MKWYLWDYDRGEIVRGPYEHAETAGAVREEIDSRVNKNLWVVGETALKRWQETLHGDDGSFKEVVG